MMGEAENPKLFVLACWSMKGTHCHITAFTHFTSSASVHSGMILVKIHSLIEISVKTQMPPAIEPDEFTGKIVILKNIQDCRNH